MAISLVQTKNVAAASATPATISMSNTTTGNMVVVGIVEDVNSITNVTAVTATGMTFAKIFALANASSSGLTLSLWYAYNITGATTPTISITWDAGGFLSAIANEYTGLTTTDPLDQHPTQTKATSVNPLSASATTTVASELLVGVFADDWGSSQTYTVGSGYGNLQTLPNTSSYDLVMEDKVVSSTGAYTAGITLGNSANWIAGIATFKGSSGAGSTAHNLTLLGVGS